MALAELHRRPDWPQRLHAFVDSIKAEAFEWSVRDCAQGFASAGVEAVTGVDLSERYSGRYATAAGAVRVLKEDGHANLADLVASHLPEIGVHLAQIGDIAAIPDDGPFGFTLGIVNGERLLVLREDGLGTLDLFRATRAFRVG